MASTCSSSVSWPIRSFNRIYFAVLRLTFINYLIKWFRLWSRYPRLRCSTSNRTKGFGRQRFKALVVGIWFQPRRRNKARWAIWVLKRLKPLQWTRSFIIKQRRSIHLACTCMSSHSFCHRCLSCRWLLEQGTTRGQRSSIRSTRWSRWSNRRGRWIGSTNAWWIRYSCQTNSLRKRQRLHSTTTPRFCGNISVFKTCTRQQVCHQTFRLPHLILPEAPSSRQAGNARTSPLMNSFSENSKR